MYRFLKRGAQGYLEKVAWVNLRSMGCLIPALSETNVDIQRGFKRKSTSHFTTDECFKFVVLARCNFDGYFLEYDDPRSGDFSPLRFVPGLGAVSRRLLTWAGRAGLGLHPKAAGVLQYGGDWAGAYLLRRSVYMPWELDELLEGLQASAAWRERASQLRAAWDAEVRFDLPGVRTDDPKACQCGEVLVGAIKPRDCKVLASCCASAS